MTASIPSPSTINGMQASARSTLLDLVSQHLDSIVRDAVAVQRHSKRARTIHYAEKTVVRSRLHASDVNMALQLAGSEKLYSTAAVNVNNTGTGTRSNTIPLTEFLNRPDPVAPPTEVAAHTHWLAVNGAPAPSMTFKVPSSTGAGTTTLAAAGATSQPDSATNPLRVHQLQSRLLSQELQFYYQRVWSALQQQQQQDDNASAATTSAVEQHQDAVLDSVQTDEGLQELVPFWVRYCQQELLSTSSSTSQKILVLRLALALLRNPNLHLELQLHELLPALVTCCCTCTNNLGNPMQDATLRRYAAMALRTACALFGSEYATLQPRILQALWQAVANSRTATTSTTATSRLASRFGGIMGIGLFGPRAVDSFLLPILLEFWREWDPDASVKKDDDKGDEQMPSEQQDDDDGKNHHRDGDPVVLALCQQASLKTLSIFLRQVSPEEKGLRLDREELQEVMGDRLVPWEGEETAYAMCVV